MNTSTSKHEQAEPGNYAPDLDRWHDDGGSHPADHHPESMTVHTPFHSDVDAAHNMAKNARENAAIGRDPAGKPLTDGPSSAEKVQVVDEAMGQIQASSTAAYRAIEAIDLATGFLQDRGAIITTLDDAAALVKEARGKLLTAERMVRAFALS